MKKILSMFLAVLMVTGCFGAFALSAAEYTAPTIAVEYSAIGADGLEADQFRVDVVIYNNPGIVGYQFDLVFDNTKVRVVDAVREYDEYDGEMKVVSAFPVTPTLSIDKVTYNPATADRVSANAARAKVSTKNGTYLSIIFKTIADFEETPLTLENVLLVAEDKSPVFFAISNGMVYGPYLVIFNANGGTNAPASQTKMPGKNLTLTSEIPTREDDVFCGWATSADGDVVYAPGAVYSEDADVTLYAVWKRYADLNGDGEINAIDAVLFAQFIVGWNVDIYEEIADCNGDGVIDVKDGVLLNQYIAGWNVILGPQ